MSLSKINNIIVVFMNCINSINERIYVLSLIENLHFSQFIQLKQFYFIHFHSNLTTQFNLDVFFRRLMNLHGIFTISHYEIQDTTIFLFYDYWVPCTLEKNPKIINQRDSPQRGE